MPRRVRKSEKSRRKKAILRKKERGIMTKVEKLLVSGTLGICTGVWVTLMYLVYLNGV